MKKIIIKSAAENNLKNIDLELPRDKMIVISGVSGSGKSSLAFDTIFAEGQRRYMESLSSYARQFLGRLDKPDVESIEGLSPVISIEQKTVQKNPRSTVGTITEIYDYFRLLYARIGKPYCPRCNIEVKEQSIDQILDTIFVLPEGTKCMILAPMVKGKKGSHKKLLEDISASGFSRVRINGEILMLEGEEEISLDKNIKHTIEIVVDRIKIKPDSEKRISDSVETAIEVSEGKVIVAEMGNGPNEIKTEHFFSEKNSCPQCGFSIPELQPRLFSFNSPIGACPECSGLGMRMEFDHSLIIPDKRLSFNEHGILPYKPDGAWNKSRFGALSKFYNFSLDTPIQDLDPKIINIIFKGSDDLIEFVYENREKTGTFKKKESFAGIIHDLNRRYRETGSGYIRDWLEGFMASGVCPECEGLRLREEARHVFIGGKNISELTALPINEAYKFFTSLKLEENDIEIAKQILKEIESRLGFLINVGLNYLTLDRSAGTLSGGEAQRIRLATQIGSSLMGVLYILDEPSIGLHQRDNERLIKTLRHLRDLGNTLIIVEHDEQTLLESDYIVDIGPGAGVHGGHVVAQGTPEEVMKSDISPTGLFLSGRERIDVPSTRRKGTGKFIEIKGAKEHNLKNIDISIPLGTLTVITGVSGSGKSTLLTDILYPSMVKSLNVKSQVISGKCDEILGTEHIDKVICIDQGPIGRTPRSNPATYVGLFTPIRDLFAALPESKARGYKPGRFSFNVKGGRCENCQGGGTKKIEMHFLSDVFVTCDVCKGKQFNRETLSVRYKGKNIHDVLAMTINEGLDFFAAIPAARKKLQTLVSVGLGYMKLGQSAVTLSGGEAQRVKLANELSKPDTGQTFYIIDEPTTGLHFRDVKQLLKVLQQLVDKNNTVCLIEHNLDVIKVADHLIDLGPEGGDKGGELIAAGTPEDITKVPKSHTGRFLLPVLTSDKNIATSRQSE